MIRSHTHLLLTLSLLLCARRAAHAAESYDNCTGFITSVPAVITTPGTWCLKQDISTAMTSGNAITINTNNVAIDCNNFKLDGLAAGLGTTAQGIYANNRLNATVRRCSIRGFLYGIDFSGALGGGHAVEDNRLDSNTNIGIQVEGDGSVVRRNRVLDTGKSTAFPDATGIATHYSVDILDNMVAGLTPGVSTSYATGIATNQNNGSVKDNHVRDFNSLNERGIYNINAGRLTLRNNDLMSNSGASFGLTCDNVSGRAKNNVLIGFSTGISGCSDDGNVIAP